MVGYRKRHDYPYGKPFPLVLFSIAMAILVLSWVVFVPGHWTRAIGIIAAFLALAYIDTKLHSHYEQTGHAVRIPRPRVVAKFPHGLPVPMLAARLVFLVIVAVMIVFGVAPVDDATARIGIVACVFALIAAAVLNLVLEAHYIKINVAEEVDMSNRGKA